VLALTFAVYGLLRKTAALGAVEGLALETLLLAPLAAPTCCGLRTAGTAASPTATRRHGCCFSPRGR